MEADPCYGYTMLVSPTLTTGMRSMNYREVLPHSGEVDEGYQSRGIVLSVIPHFFLYGLPNL